MARAIWKGVLDIGGAEAPVKLYSAVQDRKVHFRLLHDQDHVPVKQMMINPETGEEAPREQIRKGAEVEPGVFTWLDEEDMAAIEPEASRTIEIKRFIEPGRLNDQWYDRPYYLGPDEDEAAYWSLLSALEKSGREGIARWVMRKRSYVGSLRAERGLLMLISLRFAEEVIDPSSLEPPKGRALDKKELQMAEQLIAVLEDDFRPKDYRDEFRERVLDLIEKKAKGQKVTLRKPREKPKPAESLTEALRASIAAAREKAHAA